MGVTMDNTVTCPNCSICFPLRRVKYKRQAPKTEGEQPLIYDQMGICPECGHEFKTSAQVELSDYEIERNDILYNAAMDFCRVIAEDENLEYNAAFVGEIVDYAVDTMVDVLQKNIYYPAIVTTGEKSGVIEEYIEEYVKPVERRTVYHEIMSASFHRRHKK